MKTHLIFLLIVFSFSYYKKSSTTVEQQPGEHHIFIGGSIRDSLSVKSAVVIWKDGIPTRLTDGKVSAGVTGIAVLGNDVYASGNIGKKAVLWKNGVMSDLTGDAPSAFTTGIAVNGSDVYVAVNKQTAASDSSWGGIWKNGVYAPLPDNRTTFFINSIVSAGDGVFAAGREDDINYWKALYWDNGILDSLPGGAYGASASAVFASGNNRYVCGYMKVALMQSRATLWMNGSPTLIGDATLDSYAVALWVSGSDIYVLFEERGLLSEPHMRVKLWKNGTITDISDTAMAAYGAFVVEYNGDVYVLYWEEQPNNRQQVKLWKNGTVTNVTDGSNISFGTCMYMQ